MPRYHGKPDYIYSKHFTTSNDLKCNACHYSFPFHSSWSSMRKSSNGLSSCLSLNNADRNIFICGWQSAKSFPVTWAVPYITLPSAKDSTSVPSGIFRRAFGHDCNDFSGPNWLMTHTSAEKSLSPYMESKFHVEPSCVWEMKVCSNNLVTWPRWPSCPDMVKTLLSFLLLNQLVSDRETWYTALGDLCAIKFVQIMILGWPWPL